MDTALLTQGIARNIASRIQKLRKKANLTVLDTVDMVYENVALPQQPVSTENGDPKPAENGAKP